MTIRKETSEQVAVGDHRPTAPYDIPITITSYNRENGNITVMSFVCISARCHISMKYEDCSGGEEVDTHKLAADEKTSSLRPIISW